MGVPCRVGRLPQVMPQPASRKPVLTQKAVLPPKKKPSPKKVTLPKPLAKKTEKIVALAKKAPEKKSPQKIEKVVEKKVALTPEKKAPELVQQVAVSIPAPVPEGSRDIEMSVTHDVAESTGDLVHARILETWRPPRGIVPTRPCTIKVLIGRGRIQGKPEVVASSGSVVFDMTVRRALLDIVYPSEMWNRVLIIHFL